MNDVRMPAVPTLGAYRAIYHREELWRPAVDEVRARHGLADVSCERGPDGTHLVYFLGASHVLKLFVPLFSRDYDAERLTAAHVDGRLGVATSKVLSDGEVGGWRYIIMTRVEGRPLEEVWSGVTAAGREHVLAGIGRMIARLRSLPVAGLEELTVDWRSFLDAQADGAVRTQLERGLPRHLVDQIPAYLESARPFIATGFRPALLLADITGEHVLLSGAGGAWDVAGCVDFGDAMLGDPDYEIVAPGTGIAAGDRHLLRTLLLTAGYREHDFAEPLRRRLMAYTLMHLYAGVEDLRRTVPDALAAGSIEELARVLWPVAP
jgi:hygromycin-B 7''-O-kinase